MKNFIIAMLNAVKKPILVWLEQTATKELIATLIRSPWLLDFRTWATGFAVDYLATELAKPVIDYFFMKVGYVYEIIDGKHLLTELANAKNATDWESTAKRI